MLSWKIQYKLDKLAKKKFMEKVICSKYKILKKIGEGSFGKIYAGEDIETHECVAIKIESKSIQNPQLEMESKLYAYLSGCCNMPKIRYYGANQTEGNVLVMDLLGKSLEELFVQCKNKFTLKTVLMLVDQMISAIEYIHNKNFIHQDVKPDNFVMGTEKLKNQVFIIDFGLAKQYRDINSHEHIPYITGKSLTGTARYASVNQLKGNESSRRDDMEALGYVWLYFLKGSLPWMGIKAKNEEERYDKIAEIKESLNLNEVCKGLPIEFMNFLNEVRALRFAETPNYAAYKAMFRDLFMRLGYEFDYKYDWLTTKKKPSTPSLSSAFKSPDKQAIKSRMSNGSKPNSKSPLKSRMSTGSKPNWKTPHKELNHSTGKDTPRRTHK